MTASAQPPPPFPPPDRSKSKLVLKVPPKGPRWLFPLKLVGWLALTGATAAAVGLLALYYVFSSGLPEIPRVEEYWPPVVSEVYTDDAVLAGEFYAERRKIVAYDRIPKRLVQAFIASEDSSFFDHGGVDVLGTARAAFKTLLKKASGAGSVQGGSTLTQQTAKSLLVSAELSLLDSTEIRAEAERRVPPVAAPSKAEVDALAKELADAQKARSVIKGGQGAPPSPSDVREDARRALRRKAEQAREQAVKAELIRVREEQTRTAFKKATAKKLQRKIREAILAFRLERALTKEEILYLYLNNVYLGHQSYGVQSAAENYFRKDVRDLTLGEISLIAGLPQAPSRYSPSRNPEAAKRRRSYVLRRMLEEGMVSQAEHDAAKASDVKVFPVEDVFHEFAPYFTEEVRRDVADRFGSSALLRGGLKVFTTMDSEKQRAAQDSVMEGLLAVDKRQGFRGPLLNLSTPEARAELIARGKKVLGDGPLVQGSLYVALVTAIDSGGSLADVQVGSHLGKLPLLGMRWARKLNAEQYYPSVMLPKIQSALKVGDVVVVRAVERKQLTDDKEQFDAALDRALPEGAQLFRLEQEPELQSALVSIDPHRQYLVAMVGGYDFDANEFNRVFQACRQPGSSFKPLVYAAAIEQLNYTEATIIVDSPIVQHDPTHQNVWKPENYNEEFVGEVVLRTALVNSMNVPAIKTFIAVGTENMTEFSRKLGLSTAMNQDFSAALGSSCVYPSELANVYATFNRYGIKKPTHFIRKVEDRFGRTLEDHTAFDDPWAPFVDRVAAGYARLLDPGERVMSGETAFIVVDLMRGVVREGTGAPAGRLGKPAAGKTGTTNDSFDAWFAGFTRDLVTVAWVGYDLNPHPLGKYETGGRAALPIWLSYMKQALDGRPQGDFYPPGGLELVRARIDTRTGRLAASGSRDAADMWFKKGTEPRDAEPEKGTYDPNKFMELPN